MFNSINTFFVIGSVYKQLDFSITVSKFILVWFVVVKSAERCSGENQQDQLTDLHTNRASATAKCGQEAHMHKHANVYT